MLIGVTVEIALEKQIIKSNTIILFAEAYYLLVRRNRLSPCTGLD